MPRHPKLILTLLPWFLVPWVPGSSYADDWGQLATISSTMGVQAGKLCLGEASRGDIGCPSYAPSVSPTGTLTTTAISLTTSGTTWGYLGSNTSYLPNLATNAVSASNISATTINGMVLGASGSTGMAPNWPDALFCTVTSGIDAGWSYVFLAVGATNTGGFVYRVITPDYNILHSFTNISATSTLDSTYPRISNTNCNGKTISTLYAEGRAFNLAGGGISVGGGAPTGQISAFDLATCPSGWSEYTPAYGRFLRGIDKSGTGNDPSGTRVAGNVQDDLLKSHTHAFSRIPQGTSGNGGSISIYGDDTSTGMSMASTGIYATGGAETRPKNVAVLYCRKD